MSASIESKLDVFSDDITADAFMEWMSSEPEDAEDDDDFLEWWAERSVKH